MAYHALRACSSKPASPRGPPQHAPLHRRSGAAPDETFNGIPASAAAHTIPRALRHERNQHATNPYHAAKASAWLSSNGLPLPGVGLRVVDDAGRLRPSGEIGHVEVQPNVFVGYLGSMPEKKTAEEFTADGRAPRNSRPATSVDRRQSGTSPSSGAAKNSWSSPAATTSIRPRSRASSPPARR